MEKEQGNENQLNVINVIKASLLLDPKLCDLVEGHHRELVSCQTFEEFSLVMVVLFKQFFALNTITLEKKLEIIKYMSTREELPEVKAITVHLDEKSREFLETFYREMKELEQLLFGQSKELLELNQIFSKEEIDIDSLSQNKMMTFFAKMTQSKQTMPNIEQLIDPFYLGDYENLIKLREHVKNELSKASSDQLQQIISSFSSKHFVRIEGSEFELDINKLTTAECESILSFLSSSN